MGQADHERTRAVHLSSGAWLELGHELRTPLNAILGNVELLLDGSAGPLSAHARVCLSDVQCAGRRLMEQVQLVLLLLQASTTRAPVADATVDLLQVMQQTLARSSGVGVAWEIEPRDARLMVRGDPFWLDALAHAVAQAARAPAAAEDHVIRVLVESPPSCAGGATQVCIGWTAFDAERLPPISLVLMDAILRGHGGRAWPIAARGLCLHWPAARIVFR